MYRECVLATLVSSGLRINRGVRECARGKCVRCKSIGRVVDSSLNFVHHSTETSDDEFVLKAVDVLSKG